MQLIMTRIAVGYRRVSGKSQADNFSLRSQDEDIQDYCEHEGLYLDIMFTDVGSGLSIKQRPQFPKMREYALDKKTRITDVVFWDLDRFTRNIEDFFTYTKDLIKAGITLHLAVEGEKYDYNSEEKWHQRLIAAQAESKRISKRTKRGQRAATKMGLHIGKPPWGYKLIHDSDELNDKGDPIICGRLVPDPALWPHVLKFWEMSTNGSTAMQLARYLNQHNVPSPSRGPWTDGTVRYIQKNEKYCGQLFRGKNPQSRLPGPKENAPATVVENSHEAAVSPENFEKVNDGIRSRHKSQGPTRCHTSPNPMSGLLKCGECKARGIDSNLELNRKHGTVYLRCSRKKKGIEDCTFTGARLDQVLKAVVDRLRNHFLTEDTLESIVDSVAEVSKGYLQELAPRKSGISARKTVVIERIKNINDVLKTEGTRARYLPSLIDELEELDKEKEELQKIAEQTAEATEEALLFVNDKAGIIETALNHKTFTDPADPEAIRELMHIFIERVEVFQDKHGIIYYNFQVRSAEAEGTPAQETIYFEKNKGPLAPKSCGFDGSTGIDRVASPTYRSRTRLPHTRGDRPMDLKMLVLDNLNIHRPASLYETFPAAEARRIAKRLEVHYTPKHGSWLNMAEIEFSVLSLCCLKQRVPDEPALRREVQASVTERNVARATTNWRFSIQDARSKLHRLYPFDS